MRFYCDSCNTKYTIEDERVRGRVLKIKCKACGHTIELRQPIHPVSSKSGAMGPVGHASRASSGLVQTHNPYDGWYYAVNGLSTGPLSLATIKEDFASGKVGDEAYVWHETFDDWKPVASVSLFTDALGQGGRRRTKRQTLAYTGSVQEVLSYDPDNPPSQTEVERSPRIDRIDALRRKLRQTSSSNDAYVEDQQLLKGGQGNQNEPSSALPSSGSPPFQHSSQSSIPPSREARESVTTEFSPNFGHSSHSGATHQNSVNLPTSGVSGGSLPPKNPQLKAPSVDRVSSEFSLTQQDKSSARNESQATSSPQKEFDSNVVLSQTPAHVPFDPHPEFNPYSHSQDEEETIGSLLNDFERLSKDEKEKSKNQEISQSTPKSLLIYLNDLEKKDKRFKIFATLLVILVVCAGGFIAYSLITAEKREVTSSFTASTGGSGEHREPVFRRYSRERRELVAERAEASDEEGANQPTPDDSDDIRDSDAGSTENTETLNRPKPQIDTSSESREGSEERPEPSRKKERPKTDTSNGTALSQLAEQTRRTAEMFKSARSHQTPEFKPSTKKVKPSAVGTLTREQAIEGLRKVSNSVELCRERHVRRGGEFKTTKINVNLTVEGSGEVSQLEIEPKSLAGTEFLRCMNSHKPRWRFAAFNGPPQKIIRRFIIQ